MHTCRTVVRLDVSAQGECTDAIAVPPAVLAVSSSSCSHSGGGRGLSSPLCADTCIAQGNVISLWGGGPCATSP